jgi:hypothetical protein
MTEGQGLSESLGMTTGWACRGFAFRSVLVRTSATGELE